jgi:excisionase family DNA binding protein
MLTLEQVQEILNVKAPLVYALVRSGELAAGQFGGRGVWRVREDDLMAYIDAAYAKTAERIASGSGPGSATSPRTPDPTFDKRPKAGTRKGAGLHSRPDGFE